MIKNKDYLQPSLGKPFFALQGSPQEVKVRGPPDPRAPRQIPPGLFGAEGLLFLLRMIPLNHPLGFPRYSLPGSFSTGSFSD